MKQIKLLLVAVLLVSNAFAQTIKIVNKETQQPIKNIKVGVLSQDNFTLSSETTNDNGVIDIMGLITGDIVINDMDYQSFSASIETVKNNNYFIELSPVLTINTLVVSVYKWQENAFNNSRSTIGFSLNKMRFQNTQTAADLLGATGNVFVQKSQQGGGSPMIRGFSTNRLLYTVDGVRMNTAIFRTGNIQNVINLDPFAIQNTEVLFGGGSVVYGSDAIGGVMSFNTLSAQFSNTDKVLVYGNANLRTATANNERTMHVDANVGWKKWAMLTSISSNHFGDLRMGNKNGPDDYLRRFYVVRQDSVDRIIDNPDPLVQKPSGYDQINLMQKVSFLANKYLKLDYGFHFSEISQYARYDRLIEVKNNLPGSAVWEYGPQKWMMNVLNIEYSKGNKMFDKMSLKTAYQNFEESRINRNFSGGSRFRLRNQIEKVDALSLNLDFVKRTDKHEFYYGAEHVGNDVSSKASAYHIKTLANIAVETRYPNANWNSQAAYVAYLYKMNSFLKFEAGARYNLFSIDADFSENAAFFPMLNQKVKTNNSNLNYNVGAIYTPNKTSKVSVNYSTAFRAPNVDDMGKFFEISSSQIIVPNTSIKAEVSSNIELNFSKTFKNVLKVDVSLFSTKLKNGLVRRTFSVNGADSIVFDNKKYETFAVQNAAFVNVNGGNIAIELRLAKGLFLETRYNIQTGEEEMEDGTKSSARSAAPAFGLTRLTFNNNKFQMQIYAQYSASVQNKDLNIEERNKPNLYTKDKNGLTYSPSWWTLNYKISAPLNDYFSINAGVENILDRRYRPYSSGIVAPGRNFIMSLNCKF